jgi:hypothetical protein
MSHDIGQKKLPLLSRIYDIGEYLKLKFTMTTGEPGCKDRVLVEVLFQPNHPFLPHATLNDALYEAALKKFEKERLKYIKKHQPNRYKAIVQ